jgi:predicted MFS family arabinose efflux permease
MRLQAENVRSIVAALGTTQTIGYAGSYYLPAILAPSMAEGLGVPPVHVFACFTASLLIGAFVGPWAGRRIDLVGGRGILILSNFIFVAALLMMAAAMNFWMLALGFVLMGFGMGIGLYEQAFAALAALYGREARDKITGITLIAGFASTIGWPITAWIETKYGWRAGCLFWAAMYGFVALPLHWMLPVGMQQVSTDATKPTTTEEGQAPLRQMMLLSFVFTVGWFCSTSIATHLPRLLETGGVSLSAAIAAGMVIGPAQVAARVLQFSLAREIHPLTLGRISVLAYPLSALLLLWLGGPFAMLFTLIFGMGNGLFTIVKGNLPLALFGSAGYGLKQGLMTAPARVIQAFAPMIFGFVLERHGLNAIWLMVGLGTSAFIALLMIRRA